MAGSMKEKYETLSAVVLRDLAKSRGIRGSSRLKNDVRLEYFAAGLIRGGDGGTDKKGGGDGLEGGHPGFLSV